jgi:predicted NACHT family NTPase
LEILEETIRDELQESDLLGEVYEEYTLRNQENFTQWWQTNRQAWTEQLRAVMIEHRNIGHDLQFSDEQKQLLQQYYDANKLLVDCLNSDCYVSREVRQEIEETLLLPIAEIEKRKQLNQWRK